VSAHHWSICSAKRVREPVHKRRKSWISEATWRLVDQQTVGKRNGSIQGRDLRILNSKIRRSLRQDRRRRTEAAGEAIQAALENNDVRRAWDMLKRWYRFSAGRPPKPSYLDMQKLGEVSSALYKAEPPPFEPLTIHYTPAVPIPDDPPSEAEIFDAV
jgi:hypothetical protein